ncbi:VWA domain-containing protein [Brachyspira aalborgi]|uniref:VWA domain-containing protein n=1 Tax=Brachyspira aalborgi TaxID=29522 RepID=A0ABY3K714_9SPIR|nr:VWA domain-containing protein [Brachyspira aalborgi]MBS4762526.1 VWA domain-containing protein [Brachyspira sp.]CCY76286.1 vWA containing CoxE family protein [Brachyspira sp. CAG:700]TXJ19174.1 VWA domain-containing protein [Brachyspira aalborgi]TXJ31283.1 VWA domain-containing protein [Brachyspira aalborgi]TXJ40667.1 VWA domain-containing protein [Brachyspira aalborgi]
MKNELNEYGENLDCRSLNRWRLILGSFSNLEIDNEYSEIDETLNFLYDREYTQNSGYSLDNFNNSNSSKEKSALTVPKWISKVKKLFPKETVEIMQKQALEKYKLTEILTDENILKEIEPNIELLKNILTFKDMMSQNVKKLAYDIVKKTLEEIKNKMEVEIKKVFYGKKLPNSNTTNKIFKNLDIKKTIRYNLKNYDIKNKTIFTDKLFFNQNIKKYNPYNIIILIDESGSMLDSVIYSSIMASIFANLPYLSIKLVIFDISVVDLSEHIKEPIDILFKVQLGGGTNIAQALEYAKKITFAPDKTIVLLISDLFDSNDYKLMYKNANDIIESGSKLIVLTALDYNANSIYDKEAARYFSKIGAKVGALTPSKLSKWISDIIS